MLCYRITGFLDSWPKLEKWFSKFGTLRRVDATLAQTSLKLEVEKILEETLNKVCDTCNTSAELGASYLT